MTAQDLRLQILLLLDECYRQDSSTFADDIELAAPLSVDLREVQDQLEILEEQELVALVKTFGPCYAAMITPRGRLGVEAFAVREPPLIGFQAHR